MVKGLFHSPPPLKDVIFQTIQQLNVQRVKLDQVTFRLRERDRTLFHTCVMATKKKNEYRATIFANELVEVRKLLNTVSHAQIAIERIILRLETIRELGDIIVNMKPMLKTLQSVAKLLIKVMPKVSMELEKINDSFGETLAVTHVGTPRPITPSELKTPQSEKILNEVSSFLEQRLEEKLPEPPPAVPRAEPTKKVRKMIALAATCSESEVCKSTESQASLSYKDVALQSVSFTIQQSSSLEDALLEYAKRSKGKIDVVQCALELQVPYQDLMNAIENLDARGKIQIER